MARARTNVAAIKRDIMDVVEYFRPHCCAIDEDAWANLETFIAVALRVMEKTNPSKVRDVAMAIEIQCRMTGKDVVE